MRNCEQPRNVELKCILGHYNALLTAPHAKYYVTAGQY